MTSLENTRTTTVSMNWFISSECPRAVYIASMPSEVSFSDIPSLLSLLSLMNRVPFASERVYRAISSLPQENHVTKEQDTGPLSLDLRSC